MNNYLYTIPGSTNLLTFEFPLCLAIGGLLGFFAAYACLSAKYWNASAKLRSPNVSLLIPLIVCLVGIALVCAQMFSKVEGAKSEITAQCQFKFRKGADKVERIEVRSKALWQIFEITDPEIIAAYKMNTLNPQVFLEWKNNWRGDNPVYSVSFGHKVIGPFEGPPIPPPPLTKEQMGKVKTFLEKFLIKAI